MRISDWSSDVCSSDLVRETRLRNLHRVIVAALADGGLMSIAVLIDVSKRIVVDLADNGIAVAILADIGFVGIVGAAGAIILNYLLFSAVPGLAHIDNAGIASLIYR